MIRDWGPRYHEVVCIGAGLSGICLAVQLQKQFGFTDIRLYDRNESYSGTWWVNRYPGCACDIPAFFYSYSFEPNSAWSRLLPPHDEIRRYLDGIVYKYDLRPLIDFCTECEFAEWDESRHRWTVHLLDLASGQRFIHECRLLFSAVGILVQPKEPRIPGRDVFEGSIFHTARWRDDVDLRDKSVVVIGNGCSASQMVPQITPLTRSLTQCIRTPHWLLERKNIKFTPSIQWAFRHIPFFSQMMRLRLFLRLELFSWRLYPGDATGVRLRRALEQQSREYVHRVAPEKYWHLLIPDYEIACKRRVFDADFAYLKSLHAPNMHLTNDPIVEILPKGIRTTSATYPADVIIMATGFETNNGLGPLRIRGRGGEWLNDRWRSRGGPGAYNNTAVHGFPNFMMIYGPNSSTGYSSVIFAIENMVNYSLKITAPILRGEAGEVEVTAEAENAYLKRLQEASKDKVWNGACNTWYVSPGGWNSTLYPWSQTYSWWRSTFPTWRDWTYVYRKSPYVLDYDIPPREPKFLFGLLLRRDVILALGIAGGIAAAAVVRGRGVGRGGEWDAVAAVVLEYAAECIGKGRGYLGV